MKPIFSVLAAIVTATAFGQTRPAAAPNDEKALLQQAIEAVNRVTESRQQAESRTTQTTREATELKKQTADAARRLLDARAAGGAAKDGEMRTLLRDAKSRLGLPLAPQDSASAPRASGTAAGAASQRPTAATPTTAAAPGTRPPASPAAPQSNDTIITAEEGAFYSSIDGVAIFEKLVRVIRPTMRIWCDVLDVALNMDEISPKKPAPPASGANPATPEPEPAAEPGAGAKDKEKEGLDAESIRQAIAKSKENLVVIWRRTPEGEIIALCREAHYDGKTGNLILKNRPEVMKDSKLHLTGNDENAVITLYNDGRQRIEGRVQSRFMTSPSEARELRRRLLDHIPKKPGAAADGPATDSAAPEKPLENLPPATLSPPSANSAQ